MSKRHPQFYKDLALRSELSNWRTPDWLFEALNNHFNFQADVCANDTNYLCDKYFTMEKSCFDNDWDYMNFMNPPYGRQIGKFIERAYLQWTRHGRMTVALLPSRTDTKWFHNYIYNKSDYYFVRGRLRFNDQPNHAPFPSMIVLWGVEDPLALNLMWDTIQKGRDNQK